MKKITKFIPIIAIIITTVLSIFFLDIKQSKKYSQFSSYEKDFIMINYNESIKIDNSTLTEIFKIAKNSNVIIQKTNFSSNQSNIRNTYLSFETTKELYEFINKDLVIKKLNNSNDNNSFISTYYHNDKNQIGLITDLLNNNYNNYYKFDKLLSDNGNLYGSYVVYYKKYHDFNKLTSEISELLGQDIKSYSKYNDLQNYIVIIIISSILILMLFYFIFQIYEIYYKSQPIGCMKLLGYSELKITDLMTRKKMKIYFSLEIFLLILSSLFIKNITFSNLLFIFIINFILILLTFFINYICVKIIFRGYNVLNILKKQNIATKISKISVKLKFITTILFIILLSMFFQSLIPLYSELKVYRNSQELLEYGVIDSFNADAKEIYEYEKHSELYKIITRHSQLNTFYVCLDNYGEMTKDEQNISNLLEKKGLYIKYGSVDKDYLKNEKIVVYDINNNIVDIDKIDGTFFMFPKSKKQKIEAFKKFYETDSATDYKKYNIENKFQAYIYNDQKINSYGLDLNIKYVDSPILRVIDENIRISYIESPLGINTFGTSLTTGLKIKIENNKNETFEILKQDIEKAGLENLIGIDNFISYSDYFDKEIKLSRIVSSVTFIISLIIMIVYIMISVQVISLYVKSNNQKVITKYLLGYDNKKIFSTIINKNIVYNLISFIIVAIFLILINKFNILFYLMAVSLFLIIDLIILFIIIKSHNFSKIHLQLKGELH